MIPRVLFRYLGSLGGSRYLVMFVDIYSRLQQLYGTRNKIVEASLADTGAPRAFHGRSGAAMTWNTLTARLSNSFNSFGIRREVTTPSTPQENGPVLNAIACGLDLDLWHFGVDQAFIQSHRDEFVFCVCQKDAVICLVKQFDLTSRIYMA